MQNEEGSRQVEETPHAALSSLAPSYFLVLTSYFPPGHLHEFTFSCYQRKPLLTNDNWREKVSKTLDEAGRNERFDLVAFVFMPEHVHLLVNPRQQFPGLPRIHGPPPGIFD